MANFVTNATKRSVLCSARAKKTTKKINPCPFPHSVILPYETPVVKFPDIYGKK